MVAGSDGYEPTLVMTRELAAPRSLVFEAWTKAEHLDKWFGPKGFTASCVVDFRPGGVLRITLSGHGMVHTVSGVYREIVRPEKIVVGLRFEDLPAHEMLQTITFAERAGKTTITMRQDFPPWDQLGPAELELMRPRMRGAQEGWSQTLQHLAEFVAT